MRTANYVSVPKATSVHSPPKTFSYSPAPLEKHRRSGKRSRLAGFPYAFYKQEGLFQSREADEIRTLLVAIADLPDRSKRLRAWMTRFFGLSLRDLELCRDVPSGHPLMRRLIDWKELADAKDYDRLFARILDDSGVLERELFSGRGERTLVNYSHIFDTMLAQAHASGASLPESHPNALELH